MLYLSKMTIIRKLNIQQYKDFKYPLEKWILIPSNTRTYNPKREYEFLKEFLTYLK